jgi:TolB-like protein
VGASLRKLFTELRRRNIFRVAGVYGVVGWLLMQMASIAFPAFGAPDWVLKSIITILLTGFPIALLLAWAFEMTPAGVKRTEAVAAGDRLSAKTGHTLDVVIVVGLVLVGALVVWQGMGSSPAPFEAAKNAAPQDERAGLVNNNPHPEALGDSQASKDVNPNPDAASIAVLPFTDLSPNKDQEYFSDGMAEEILNVLVRVDDLKVASRTSAFGFKGQEALGIPTIAKKLNVRHVLEGSVRKSGNMIRITAQLIDAQTDQHLWSQTYDRTLTAENIFAIQDEIANEIVKQLGIKIGGDNPKSAKVRVAAGTENLDAYELFLRGHNKFLTRNDIPGTISLFERAVVADPGFARAWAGLAAVYSVAPSWNVRDRDYYTLAIKSANTAIALNPDLALPYAVLGNLVGDKLPVDFTQAFALLDEAIKRDPKETSAWLWRGIFNNMVGYIDKAEQDFAQCLALDPAYENCRRHMALSKLYAGDIKRAMELYEQGRMNGAGARDTAFLPVYAAMGDFSTVLASLYYQMMSSGSGDFSPLIALEYRAVTQPNFDFEKERSTIEATHERVTGKPLDWTSITGQRLALTYRNYAAVKNPESTWPIWWQPYPAALRATPHRKRWMIEVGLPAYWRKNGFPPQCKPVGDHDFECD